MYPASKFSATYFGSNCTGRENVSGNCTSLYLSMPHYLTILLRNQKPIYYKQIYNVLVLRLHQEKKLYRYQLNCDFTVSSEIYSGDIKIHYQRQPLTEPLHWQVLAIYGWVECGMDMTASLFIVAIKCETSCYE